MQKWLYPAAIFVVALLLCGYISGHCRLCGGGA
jgi:hypothetical protein